MECQSQVSIAWKNATHHPHSLAEETRRRSRGLRHRPKGLFVCTAQHKNVKCPCLGKGYHGCDDLVGGFSSRHRLVVEERYEIDSLEPNFDRETLVDEIQTWVQVVKPTLYYLIAVMIV